MSNTAIVPGSILHWEEFKFEDGGSANKFLVIVGAKTGSNYLAVIATSKPHWRKFEPGAHPIEGYYCIPGGGKEWFPKDTWLLVAIPREIRPAELVREAFAGRWRVVGQLRPNIVGALRNCLKQCPDVSPLHVALL